MDTGELLKKVRKLEIKTRGLSKHLFSGEYHSAFKGRGMSFSEVREYQYGDDVRSIDWNVTARTGDPHIKIFEEERELTVMLLVDLSGSSFFGSRRQMKHEIITEICAVLAFSAIQNNDKVGVLFFTDRIELFIPPKKGKQHILRIIRELLQVEPVGHQTDIGLALEFFNNLIKKRSIVFLLSDFMDRGYDKPLRVTARRHDLVGLHIYDPRERDLPKMGLLRVRDPESGALRWIDSSVSMYRRQFREGFEKNEENMRQLFFRSGADLAPIRTDEPYVQKLLQFFQRRSQHR